MDTAISHAGLLALLWAGTGVATILTLGRIVIRVKRFHHLLWDDFSQILAWVLMLAENITFTLYYPVIYKLTALEAGIISLPPNAIHELSVTNLKYLLPVRLVFWSCLWAAKGAFLALYWQLFNPSRSFVRAWWAVLAFTTGTYFVCVTVVLTACRPASDLLDVEKCNSHHWGVWYIKVMFAYTTVANILSDVTIMSLALWKTWGLKMRTSQKVSLSGIYGLVVVVLMVFDIVRIVESLVYLSWTRSSFFDIFEVVLVVIIAALPGYRMAMTGHWLDETFQRIASLTSSSKKSLRSRLGKKSSRDVMDSDQDTLPHDSGSTSHNLEVLKDKEARLGFAPTIAEYHPEDKSFRAGIEGV